MRSISSLIAATLLALALASAMLVAPLHAKETGGPVLVVELFTSEACPACPVADAVVSRLAAADAAVLPLDLHVTWFDRAGWKDSLSLPAASNRQQRYAALLGVPTVYTPQVVVGGRYEALGYDGAAVRTAVGMARQQARASVALEVAREGDGLRLAAGPGAGEGKLFLVGFDGPGRGAASNKVRSLEMVGRWTGAPFSRVMPAPTGRNAALLLQDRTGAILAAAVLN